MESWQFEIWNPHVCYRFEVKKDQDMKQTW